MKHKNWGRRKPKNEDKFIVYCLLRKRTCGDINVDMSILKGEANKYASRTEFSKGSPGTYDIARALGLLDEVCRDIPTPDEIHDFILECLFSEYRKE